ncbi:sugar ABC transporter substrate-binding protein [Robinsoniella peoriensis]|uniref:D-ribose-binding periplasmic protein n=1 Tax=Robinsoniella peoriensis TaxID=180332 RepID=A0A4V6HRB5_9FIRM|nr:sugar ABC transporter substrate-binding protein [Robinsoniella peoriensis]MDU7030556.1 sugar ABC transporter substrate-binding protein [Clostridiales bacterium]TLC98427.1 D-ribose-binding periplasmic protein precursor [Robinsoniella peoriensis]
MKMKKLVTMLAVSAMLTGMLAGCTSGSEETGTTTAKETTAPQSTEAKKETESSKDTEAKAESETDTAMTDTEAKEDASTGSLKGKRIAVAHISMYDEWCTGVYDELMAQKDKYGIAELNVQDANFSIETQKKNVEDFISQGYDAILIDIVDSEAIKDTLDKAYDAGIPIVAFDSGTDWEHLISHIKWDHAETGKLTAQWVADYATKNLGGKVKVGMITYNTLAHVKVRGEAFTEELESLLGVDNIEYVYKQDFDQTREGASNITTNNIAKPVDVIWGAVDNAAFGAKIALENAGAKDTIVVSAGGWGAETFNAINDNNQYYKAAVAVPPAGIVQYSYDTLEKYFAGDKDIPKTQDIELKIVDASNIADYMGYIK